MPQLTVTVITRDESAHIEAALTSAAWADERIVVDSGSTDDTVALARPLAHRVVTRDWRGFADQKNYAASLASHDWILSLDADERITPTLAAEIRALMASDPPAAGYRVPRVSFYLGTWIRGTDWYPDYQLRLYDRRRARWVGRYVHEGVEVDGRVGRLRGELQHYPYRNIAHHLQTIDRYTTLAARQSRERGQHAGMLHLLVHPPLAFLRNYLLRGGIRAGGPGLVVSLLNSYYVFLKLAKLWEIQRATDTAKRPHA